LPPSSGKGAPCRLMSSPGQILLHCCCAPDSTVPVRRLEQEGWHVVCAFYGSNIHPEEEYRYRLEDMVNVAKETGTPLRVLPYDPEAWFRSCRLLAGEPERGRRCNLCYALQIQAAALCAVEEKCTALCTTLTISPHKDPVLVNRIGGVIARKNGLDWVDRTWRKAGGFLESVRESRRLGLRRQVYCGCRYSIKGDGTQ